MSSNYIGLASSPHDPALAIVNSKGEVVFAEATERYLQNKRAWNCAPDDIIRIEKLITEYCEERAVLVIATTWSKRHRRRIRWTKSVIFPLFLKRILPPLIYRKWLTLMTGLLTNYELVGNNIEWRNLIINPSSKIIRKSYDHHLCHAAAACYSSPFKEAVCAVADGYGEASTTAFYRYKHGKISKLSGIKPSRRASLGSFYSDLCFACGFDPIKGEQWKVMGLAPYGKLDQKVYKILRSFSRVKNCRLVSSRQRKWNRNYSELMKQRRNPKDSPFKSADLAYTGQKVFCELMTEIHNSLYKLNLSENLVFTGGCALNSAYNGIILERTPFKNLYVFSAPGDDGNSLGAALLAYYEDNPPERAPAKLQLPYLGERMSSITIKNLQKFGDLRNKMPSSKKLHERVAELLAKGKIIGWIQGRAEFGPRALGNRSILADPRSADIKNKLNAEVKFRDEFQPFAPSILHEYGHEYFENYVESPYMERTLRFKKEVVEKVPGVVHVDGTGRLQTIKREWNEKFYDLIAAFKEITGIPLLLNTSFNVMGKPITHSVEDAIAVFFTTGLDVLVIEDQLYEKDHSRD